MSRRIACWAGVAAATLIGLASPEGAAAAPAPLQIRVVVVTTFEVGNDSGDMPGEFQNWVEHYPLPVVLPFPQGFRSLRYNAKDRVLGIVTGAGKVVGGGLDHGPRPRPALRPQQSLLDPGGHRRHRSQPGLGGLGCMGQLHRRRRSSV